MGVKTLSVNTDVLRDGAVAAPPFTLADSLRPTAARSVRRIRRESAVRRLLVFTDVVALTVSVGMIKLWGGFDSGNAQSALRDLALLAFGIPVWILLAQGHNLYHADSRRADHGWTEEVMPIIQMATLWSWTILLGISVTGIRPVTIPKLAVFWVSDDRSAPAASVGGTMLGPAPALGTCRT